MMMMRESTMLRPTVARPPAMMFSCIVLPVKPTPAKGVIREVPQAAPSMVKNQLAKVP